MTIRVRDLEKGDIAHVLIGDSLLLRYGTEDSEGDLLCEADVTVLGVGYNGCLVKIDKVTMEGDNNDMKDGMVVVALWDDLKIVDQ
jgi:hypothetical protein